MKVVALIHNIFEDLELWYPVIRLREAGIDVVLASEKKSMEYTGKHGVPASSDISFDELDPVEFDGVLVPGGYAPDKVRRYQSVLKFLNEMDNQGKPIAQICHAGWVLVSAGILQNRKVTSTPAIKDDLINAGAKWINEPVVIDKNLVSSRNPNDLHLFAKAFIELLKES
jgi:protease I